MLQNSKSFFIPNMNKIMKTQSKETKTKEKQKYNFSTYNKKNQINNKKNKNQSNEYPNNEIINIILSPEAEKRKLINKVIDLLNLPENKNNIDNITNNITKHINSYNNKSYENIKMYSNRKNKFLEFEIFNRKNKIIKDIKINYWDNIDEIKIYLGNCPLDYIERHSFNYLKEKFYNDITTLKIPSYMNILGFPNNKNNNIKISIQLKNTNNYNFSVSYKLYDINEKLNLNYYENNKKLELPITTTYNIKHNFNLSNKNKNKEQIIDLKPIKGNLHGIKINCNYMYFGIVKFFITNSSSRLLYEKLCNIKYDEEIKIDESKMLSSSLDLNSKDVNSNIKLTLYNKAFKESHMKYFKDFIMGYNNEVRLNLCIFYRNILIIENKQISKNIIK